MDNKLYYQESMNKFSKLINKIDGFYRKAQDSSGVTSSDAVGHLNAFLGMFDTELNSSTKSLLNQVARNLQSNKADKESVQFAIDKLKEESAKGNGKLSSNVDDLINKTLTPLTKTLSDVKPSSQSGGQDLLGAVKSTISQIKTYVDKNIGSDKTPVAVGGERSKQLSVVRSMISGLSKSVSLAASKYSSEYMGIGKYTQLLKALDDLAMHLQIKLGSEYKDTLEHSMQVAIASGKLKLEQFTKKEKSEKLDLSPFENKKPQVSPESEALNRI